MKKKLLLKDITQNLSIINEVKSITFVGSFLKSKNFSDIDIVVLVSKLNKDIFKKCNDSVKKIKTNKYNINKKIYINNSFGPLKFNEDKFLVLHLMIYSINDHLEHTLKSPFTCYDWERSSSYYGPNLKDICSVGKLNLYDFKSKYRGIEHYKKNLSSGYIDYKQYYFTKNGLKLKKKKFKINGKHLIEFSYHIIRNLCNNFLKFLYNKNYLFPDNKHFYLIKLICPMKEHKDFILLYKLLKKKKLNFKNSSIDKNFKFKVLDFLNLFSNYVDLQIKSKKKILFKRHFKTSYKNKIFIGNKIDPDILSKKVFKKKNIELAYTSNATRTYNTAKKLKIRKIVKNNLLREINYGKAEGLDFNLLKKKFPEMIKKWERKQDPKFPSGESHQDVRKRVIKFCNLLKKVLNNLDHKSILIVTHNVFLRSLLGYFFNLPIYKWYLIDINYGQEIEFCYLKGKIYPNLNRSDSKKIFNKIYENSFSN